MTVKKSTSGTKGCLPRRSSSIVEWVGIAVYCRRMLQCWWLAVYGGIMSSWVMSISDWFNRSVAADGCDRCHFYRPGLRWFGFVLFSAVWHQLCLSTTGRRWLFFWIVGYDLWTFSRIPTLMERQQHQPTPNQSHPFWRQIATPWCSTQPSNSNDVGWFSYPLNPTGRSATHTWSGCWKRKKAYYFYVDP